MNIQADVYKGCRGDGAEVLAVTSLFVPKCLGLRPPKFVTLGEKHETFWRCTHMERPVSHLLKTRPFTVSIPKSLLTFTVMALDILSQAVNCNRWCLVLSCVQG